MEDTLKKQKIKEDMIKEIEWSIKYHKSKLEESQLKLKILTQKKQ